MPADDKWGFQGRGTVKVWRKLKDYVELMKPFSRSKSTLYYGLTSLMGSVLASPHSLQMAETLKAMFSSLLAAFAIYALNDVCDVEVDRINAPERPLPSGRVSVVEAEALVIALFTFALSLASTVNPLTLAFTAVFSVLGVAYSVPPLRLKDGWFAEVCWGLGIAATVLCGASVAEVNLPVAIASAILALLTAGCGMIKDLKDMEGDRAKGIRTIPILIGEEKTVKLMTATFTAVFPLLPVYGITFYSFNMPYTALATLAAAIFAYSLILLNRSPKNRSLYRKTYKIQAASGFILNIAFLLLGI